MKSRVDGVVPSASAVARLRLGDLKTLWGWHLAELDRIIDEEVSGFNAKYKGLGLPALILPAGAEVKVRKP